MPKKRKAPPGVDAKLLIKDAAKLLPRPSRRLFLRGAASLGSLAMLTGCDIIDGPTAENALHVVSRFNDRVQALLFSETTLAPEFPESAITRPFPFNAYYSVDEAPDIDGDSYQLEIGGLVNNKKPWTLAELNRLPQVSQITRLVCVEGWSAIARWGGIAFADLLKAYPPAPGARWAALRSDVSRDARGNPDPYFVSLDLATAAHPQTLLATEVEGRPLPLAHGAPLRLVAPVKLGLKNIKAITHVTYTAEEPPDFWALRGYSKYDGL
jgi:DMSO/TMAO reductase YedYZ molybdopterin-dependent catalytic subunit